MKSLRWMVIKQKYIQAGDNQKVFYFLFFSFELWFRDWQALKYNSQQHQNWQKNNYLASNYQIQSWPKQYIKLKLNTKHQSKN